MSDWPSGAEEALAREAATTLVVADSLWEEWRQQAEGEGVHPALAALGASLIAMAQDRDWQGERLAEAGWLDQGEAMLELALCDPMAAETRWEALLTEAEED